MPFSVPLIQAYDSYGDLSADRYFTIRYGSIASTAEVDVPITPQKTSYQRVLAALDVDPADFEVVFQEWKIARHSGTQEGDDFIKYALLASKSSDLLVEFQTYSETISVEFFYREEASDLRTWVFKQLDLLRTTFGKPEKPLFRVLTKVKGDFRTRVIDIEPSHTDLSVNYNDGLQDVDRIIQQSIEKKSSGLILLHGIPGTGKTTYVKTLVTRNREEKFIFIPNDFVDEMLKPSFITFLISQKNSILVIEDAESVIMSRETTQNKSVVSTILQITDGLFSDYLNIKVICTFNTDVSKIDKALFRKGRMIAFYEFGELSDDKAMAIAGVSSVADLPETRTLAELYNRESKSFEEASRKKTIGFGN